MPWDSDSEIEIEIGTLNWKQLSGPPTRHKHKDKDTDTDRLTGDAPSHHYLFFCPLPRRTLRKGVTSQNCTLPPELHGHSEIHLLMDRLDTCTHRMHAYIFAYIRNLPSPVPTFSSGGCPNRHLLTYRNRFFVVFLFVPCSPYALARQRKKCHRCPNLFDCLIVLSPCACLGLRLVSPVT